MLGFICFEGVVLMLEFRNLAISPQTKHSLPIIENLNGELCPGELTILLGVNGVGKSTLLKTLVGILPKISGEIKIDQRPCEKLSSKERAQKIAVVLTDKMFDEYLNVRELVTLSRFPFIENSWTKLDLIQQRIIDEALDFFSIKSLADKPFKSLSDGQKQKVLLARAKAQNTPYLLLDEPTTFLDIPSKIELFKMLKKLTTESGKGIVLSTHDWSLAKVYADKIWFIERTGKFYQMGPKEFVSSGALASEFKLESM